MAALLTTDSVLQCPHGGSVTSVTSNGRAKASGAFVLRAGDTFTIAGCPFTLGSSPHPCVRIQWLVSALRTKVVGDTALNEDSVGLCVAADNAPQGTALINSTQHAVSGQ